MPLKSRKTFPSPLGLICNVLMWPDCTVHGGKSTKYKVATHLEKIREFQHGQGKVRKNKKSQWKVARKLFYPTGQKVEVQLCARFTFTFVVPLFVDSNCMFWPRVLAARSPWYGRTFANPKRKIRISRALESGQQENTQSHSTDTMAYNCTNMIQGEPENRPTQKSWHIRNVRILWSIVG